MAMSTAANVLIADDHGPTRTLIREVMEEDGFHVCAEVESATEAIRAADENELDVAILDIRMPGNGLHACEVIRSKQPEICIVMLTVSEDMVDLLGALAAGASGYWLKGEEPQLIPWVVRRVLSGELIIAGMLLKNLLMGQGVHDVRRRLLDHVLQGASFTPKEYEVIELMSEGMTTAEIGDRLFVADVTVRTHIANIVRKLNAVDRDDVRRMISKSSETSYFNAKE
jgi:two-component system, NarL family, nitrate/nitrite response regulator NarL